MPPDSTRANSVSQFASNELNEKNTLKNVKI